ncbi:ATP-binding protein [Chryseolinea sp. T2]|uniref:ATP-binding protein n=1 Tax=Chryseolinea sp. T2 TaxID=3129255 RepID=UPI003077D21A
MKFAVNCVVYHKKLSIVRFLIFSRLAIWLLTAAFLLAIVTLSVTHIRNGRSRNMELWIEHTYDVIQTSQFLLAKLSAADALEREALLEPSSTKPLPIYRHTLKLIDSTHTLLSGLIEDNIPQSKILKNKITPLINAQVTRWQTEITGISNNPAINIAKLNVPGRNEMLYSTDMLIWQLIKNEKALLAARKKSLRDTYILNDLIRWSCLSAIAGICLGAISVVYNQQRTNNRLLVDLTTANSELEDKVAKRTRELESRNKSLSDSIEEIVVLNQHVERTNSILTESLQEVQFLYEYAPCGYHTVDRDGNIIKINKTELEWLGYTEDEVIGKKKVADVLTAESLKARTEAIEELKKLGRLEGLEFELVRKDGSTLPVLLNTIAYFDENGEYLKNRSTLFNISDRKLLEQNLNKANKRLHHLNEQKDNFLGMATHDLKNPMHSITGILGLIRLSGGLTDEQSAYLELIGVSVKRMQNLVGKLLDLNMLERMEVEVTLTEVNVKELINSVVDFHKITARKKDIGLKVEVCTQIPIVTDGILVSQILDNLLSNALKFSSAGTTVAIRAFENEAGNVRFEVQDQGPGITREEMGKLFGAFQRLSARPTAGEPSSGLGLSIVKALAQILHCEILVDSKMGVGTTFSFVI